MELAVCDNVKFFEINFSKVGKPKCEESRRKVVVVNEYLLFNGPTEFQ